MNSELDQWVERAAAALDISDSVDVDEILKVAKDVAHNVVRPAAPVTTYLIGLAVAHGMTLHDATTTISRLAVPDDN